MDSMTGVALISGPDTTVFRLYGSLMSFSLTPN